VRLRRASTGATLLVAVVVAAEKFVAFDCGDDANSTFVARFGALHSSQTTNADRACKRNLVRQGQEDLDSGTLFDFLGKKEINAPGANVAGFRAGLADRRTRRPSDGKRQPHLKSLGVAAFGASQGGAS
jgi:hypothetical protein